MVGPVVEDARAGASEVVKPETPTAAGDADKGRAETNPIMAELLYVATKFDG
jgi:hypothetical protein